MTPNATRGSYSRVGRTGRAGARGLASTLVSAAEVMELRRIEQVLKLRIEREFQQNLVCHPRRRENNLPGGL